jgi:hypothetical protein
MLFRKRLARNRIVTVRQNSMNASECLPRNVVIAKAGLAAIGDESFCLEAGLAVPRV